MEKRLREIYEKNVSDEFVLDKNGVFKSMEQSYELGTQDVLTWLSKMDNLSDNIQYIIEEWNNIKGGKS
jgi:hypothetical protein